MSSSTSATATTFPLARRWLSTGSDVVVASERSARDAQIVANSPTLAQKIGRLVRLERERQGLTQAALCRRAALSHSALSHSALSHSALSHSALSRLERGSRGVTTTIVDEILASLGFQLTIDVEPLDSQLDAMIAKHYGLTHSQRDTVVGRFRFPMSRLMTAGLYSRLAGGLGAFLHGVPTEALAMDLAITLDGAEAFKAWLTRIPSALRWSERHRDFIGYSKDPRDPEPARWNTPGGEIRAIVLDELPEPVIIRFGEVDYPVLPLPLIAAHDPQVARVVDRLAQLAT